MSKVLVVANETIGGRPLLDALRARHRADPDLEAVLCVPRTPPHHGLVVYDHAVAEATRVRGELARMLLREWEGISATVAIGDPDPYTAALDALDDHAPDEILVSTKPATTSGWLRRDLVRRIARATEVPVSHVVADARTEELPFAIGVVLTDGRPDVPAVARWLEDGEMPAARRAVVFVVPGDRDGTGAAARRRLASVLGAARGAGAGRLVAGMTGPPDPYTAAVNAVEALHADGVAVALGNGTAAPLAERLRRATGRPVAHLGAPGELPAAA